GLVGTDNSSPQYQASKGAVRLLTKATAIQYAREGIRANSVHPGPIVTPMTERRRADPAVRQLMVSRIPLGRYGEPDEVAYGVLYLASDESAYVTGSGRVTAGGWTAQERLDHGVHGGRNGDDDEPTVSSERRRRDEPGGRHWPGHRRGVAWDVQAPSPRGVRHPQRLRDDDGSDPRRRPPRRRAREERRHRRRRARPQGGRRGGDRRTRHDRAAGLRRHPLAHVEYAASEHGGRQAGARLLPDRGDPGQGVHARGHLPGDPAGCRGGAVQRVHVRPRLVSQHPSPRICRRQLESTQGIRAARSLLVWDATGASAERDDRSRRPRAAPARLEEPLGRGPARPRAGLARHGRGASGSSVRSL